MEKTVVCSLIYLTKGFSSLVTLALELRTTKDHDDQFDQYGISSGTQVWSPLTSDITVKELQFCVSSEYIVVMIINV